MATKQILIPDIGDFQEVAIIDVYIKVGDTISAEDSVVALESEKAVIDIPSPFSGKVTKVLVKEGDLVSKDSPVAEIEVAAEGKPKQEEKKAETAKAEPKEAPPAPKQIEEPEPTKQTEPKDEKPEQKETQEQGEPASELIDDQASGALVHATPSLR